MSDWGLDDGEISDVSSEPFLKTWKVTYPIIHQFVARHRSLTEARSYPEIYEKKTLSKRKSQNMSCFYESDYFNYNMFWPEIERTSTPLTPQESSLVSSNNEWTYKTIAYELFVENLRRKPISSRIRGLRTAPPGILSGHIIPPRNYGLKESSIDFLDCSYIELTSFQKTVYDFRRKIRGFFKKKIWKRKCDGFACDKLTCRCRKNQSILNQRITESL